MPFEFDTSEVSRMIRDLATLAGHGSNTRQALDVSAGKILDTAIRFTPMSKDADLIERVDFGVQRDFARYDAVGGGVLTTNIGRRGQLPSGTQWLRETSARTGQPAFFIMRGGNPRRWSNARWGRYQATAAQREQDLTQSLAIRRKQALGSVGLTPQSWSQVADDLGIPLYAPKLGRIRAAVASNGQTYKNGTGTRLETADGYTLTIENRMPGLIRNGGAEILQRAIDIRLAGFENDMKHGVFADLDLMARRYKGLTITASY